ncbi:hypothetical protein HG535_0A02690 [Zygotorulaspora mrakii]|uniref:Ca3427-like PBP 2 domain-containing protein n=1 Tax=Zygotorulaspora mrakii TaxID=42260 RepID=A0A7H9AVU1_ZYGMR|nr:uncharacterized protein HG535_0A02690 [Zygotorulaspora mrakii]QLG70331.1 hypothetical protein HG535_0A02690 [Zygotorulaspora mrakii]
MSILRVGYIPEHFSTPIQFARLNGYFKEQGTTVELIEYPSGSGHLISSLNADEIDIAVGLTEAFVRGIADTANPKDLKYEIVGTYVNSPLNWAVSTGVDRDDINSLKDLQNGKMGVSRIGSGSYVMSFVLAADQGFEEPFQEFPVCHTFQQLRKRANDGSCDAFMWEYYTTKKYYESPKELKMVGNIYTPWPSWVIVRNKKQDNKCTLAFTKAIDLGIEYFNKYPQDAIDYIHKNLDYSEADAREWLKTVEFNTSGCHNFLNSDQVILKTLGILRSANVLQLDDVQQEENMKYGIAQF